MTRTKAGVAHLTSVHSPFDTRIFEKECRSLAASGRLTTIVCRNDVSTSTEGVQIVAVARPQGGRLKRMLFTPAKILRGAVQSGAPIIHFHDPELIPVALLLKLLGRRIIYDVHEDLPLQVLNKTWIWKPLLRPTSAVVKAVEKLASAAFDGLVAATPTIAERFPAAKTVVVQNFPIQGAFENAHVSAYAERPFAAVYIGSLSVERGGLVLAELAAALNKRETGLLHVAGPLADPALADRLKAPTRYHGVLDRNAVRDLLSASRVGLVTLQPSPRFLDAYPVKLFEYWSAGLPVIASDFPLWRSIITDAGGGLLVDPTNAGKVREAIEWIFANPDEAEAMGQRGRAAILSRYNWSSEEAKLLALYARIDGM